MIEVGTNAGSAHRQREGTGLAHILTGDGAVDTYGRIWQIGEAERMRRDAVAAAKRDTALKGLKEYDPEFAYQHRSEMQPQIETHIQLGSEMLARGVDPFTGNSAESIAWQKEHQRLSSLAQNSMQVQKEVIALKQDLDKSDPNDFTADSLAQNLAWQNRPLSETLSSGVNRPPLLKKRAWADASEFIGKNMKIFDDGHEGADPRQVEDFVINLLQQPANADKVAAYAQKFVELPEEERRRVQQAAQDGHREVYQQLALEDGLRYQKGKGPLDFQKEVDKAATDATSRISYSDWQQGERSGKAPKKGEADRQAKNAAEEMFNSRPDWMTFFDRNGELPRSNEETDSDYAVRVKALLASKVRSRIKTDTQYRVDKSGSDEQKLVATQDQWIADVRSGDPVLAKAASDLLVGTKFANNLAINDIAINPAWDNGQALVLNLKTNLSLKDVKDQIVEGGIAADDIAVEERQGEKIVTIGIGQGDIANQALGRLYSNFHKETGSYYDPKLSERGIKTAAGIVPSMPTQPTPTIKKAGALDGLDIFK